MGAVLVMTPPRRNWPGEGAQGLESALEKKAREGKNEGSEEGRAGGDGEGESFV